jgi:hypothetical protein
MSSTWNSLPYSKATHLQCTTIGPGPVGVASSFLRYDATDWGYSGTPWSGHEVKWRCWIYNMHSRTKTDGLFKIRSNGHTDTIPLLWYIRRCSYYKTPFPCQGWVEYLHHSLANGRRWWKRKSQIWDSKIWSQVPWDSDLRVTALARASSNCKWQTHPLDRESAPHQHTRNCLTAIKIWS